MGSEFLKQVVSNLGLECSADPPPPSLNLKNGPKIKLWAKIQATLLEVTLLWFMVKNFPQVGGTMQVAFFW